MAEYLGKTGLAYLWGKIKSNFAAIAHTHTGADLRPVAATSSDGVSYTATVPGLTELYAGLTLTIIPDKASTVITPTLNVNGLGAKIIIMPVCGVNTAVTTNAAKLTAWLSAGAPVVVKYDGTRYKSEIQAASAQYLYGVASVTSGGTGADNAADARVNLGIETSGGTVTSQNADYAEIEEWADGNAGDEDRIGYFVAVDTSSAGTTIVKATSTADVRGVTVSAPAFSGNCASSKYDAETGELLKQYDYVAVMGLVSVIDNGTCTINGRCMPSDDGTAVPSSNNLGYQVIDRIDSTHVLIAVEPGVDMIQRIKTDVASKADLVGGKVPTEQLPEISSVKTYTATIGTTWTENEDTGVKSQQVAISGVLATQTAKVDHAYTGSGTSDDYAAFVEAENQYLDYITNGYAETYDGGVQFYIFGDAPTVEIPIVVEVA